MGGNFSSRFLCGQTVSSEAPQAGNEVTVIKIGLPRQLFYVYTVCGYVPVLRCTVCLQGTCRLELWGMSTNKIPGERSNYAMYLGVEGGFPDVSYDMIVDDIP